MWYNSTPVCCVRQEPGRTLFFQIERTGPTGGGPARFARHGRAAGGWERGVDRATSSLIFATAWSVDSKPASVLPSESWNNSCFNDNRSPKVASLQSEGLVVPCGRFESVIIDWDNSHNTRRSSDTLSEKWAPWIFVWIGCSECLQLSQIAH